MFRLVSILPGIVLFMGLCSACAPQNVHTVILTPDPDGHVGKAEVVTAGGKQLLEAPNAMTTISELNTAPSSVTTASAEYMKTKFSQVLAVEPIPAEKFIIFFKNNSSEMTAESQASFFKILDGINKRKAISIKISGHTDSTGTNEFNLKLSSDRARTIKKLLTQHGFSPEKMEVSSHGERNQLVPTANNVAEPKNRRVEIIVR